MIYWLNYNCKDFDIIQIFVLFEAFNNLTSFVAKNFVIYILLDFVNLFITKNVTFVKYYTNNINVVFLQKFYLVCFN